MQSNTKHWNEIFSRKNDQELGWYENDTSQTLKYLSQTNLSSESCIFLPGAGTSNLVDKLLETNCHLILNDISDAALAKLKDRLGDGNYELLHHDMGLPLSRQYEVDMWLDRAVLHFLLSENDIFTYFQNLKMSVKDGGYVLLAEFSKTGASKCAGLNVHQYSIEEMLNQLGEEFKLIDSEDYLFINPYGQEKPYVYALFRKSTVDTSIE